MDDTLNISLGDKTYTVATLNLIQQRAIGSALFSVKASAQLNPDTFDFEGEFDSAARIVFAAVSLVEPEKDKEKWLSGIKVQFRDLQRAKADVLRFAGYMRTEPSAHPVDGAQASGEVKPVAE